MDEYDLVATVSLKRLLWLCNPVETPPWHMVGEEQDAHNPITKSEISTILAGKERIVEPYPSGSLSGWDWSREKHLQRIAYLIENCQDWRVEIDVGVFELPRYLISDGNHRLVAAWYLNHETINVGVSGSLDRAKMLLGIRRFKKVPIIHA